MKKFLVTLLLVSLLVSLSACGSNPATKTDLTISAAASVQDAILILKEKYEEKNKGINLLFNFGASGSLMKQIEEGADVDLFISAGKSQVDQLEEKDLLVNESRINLLGNDLVLIVNENYVDKIKSLNDLLNLEDKKIAMGEPESVPAGKYTLESLENLDLYSKLKGNMVFTKDVRQVVSYVDDENAVAGFCYGSDATIAKNSSVAEIVPEDSHKPIVYPAAIIKATKNSEEIKKFFDFLQTDESMTIFKEYGFKSVK